MDGPPPWNFQSAESAQSRRGGTPGSWAEGQLVGESISAILPPSFREFHHAGFARFQLTESSKVVGHPLTLATVCSDGSEVQSEHYIVAEKYPDGSWSFAATLRPLEGPYASSAE